MENTIPCDLKLRRAFTDFGKPSVDEALSRSRQFPRLFKQTSFASALIPNFNKNFKLWNNWTSPEISRANQIVLEHLKSRRVRDIRPRINEVPHTVPTCGADLQNHTRATRLKRTNSEVNNSHVGNSSNGSKKSNEKSSERQLILPKLEKDCFSSNNYEREKLLRFLKKWKTKATNTNKSSSLCDGRAQRSTIDANRYLGCDLSLPSLENCFSTPAGDQSRQDGARNDLIENHTEGISVNGGDRSSGFFLAEKRENSRATVTEARTSLKVDFLKLPSHSFPFCNNGTTTAGIKRKVYHGDIANPVSTNDKLFRICVWAGRDMSEECTAFHNGIFPRLKHLGQQTGVHIEIFDLHLNQNDPTFLDSFRLELFNTTLDKCLDSGCQFRAVIMLGEKYGSPILPSTISSLEYISLHRQLIHRLDAQAENDQRLGVPRSIRSSGQNSHRSRTGSAASGRRLKPPRNHAEKSGGSVSRVGTPTNKSPLPTSTNKSPRIGVANDILPTRNEGDNRRVISSSNGDRSPRVPGRSELVDLYRIDDQGVYRLKTLRFSESKSGEWNEEISTLLDVLSKLKPTPEHEKYQQSLLHAVLSFASFCTSKTTATDDNLVCVVRHIPNMNDSLETSRNYFDTNADNKNRINRRLHQKMKKLRSDFICSKVPSGNLVELQLDLQEDVAQSVRHRQFALYVDRMQEKLYDKLAADISNLKNEPEDKLLQEVLHHVAFCQQRVRESCLIQKTILHAIMDYVTSTKPHVFILYGPDGSGKTTLMSLAAIHMTSWTESFHSKSHVLVRAIGCTRDSTNIYDLLHGLCTQLQDIFHISAPVPTDYTGLINQFAQMLSCACAIEKLVIFLDGVDLLEGTPETTLQWIPIELPAFVRLIISTRSQDKHGNLKFLQRSFVQPDVFKEILPLDESDTDVLFNTLQKQYKRVVPPKTRSEIIKQMQTDRFPLNLALFVAEHFSAETTLKSKNLSGFGPSAKQLIMHKFDGLEQQFGRTFVQRVLGHLTAAKFGLAFNELEAVLTIDKTSSVNPSHSSFEQRSSYQLLSFLSELRSYLRECVDGICRVICWSHWVFYEAADERYLKNPVQTQAYQKGLARFFNCGVPVFNSDDPKTLPDVQPLFYNGDDESLTKRYFNCRKLKELPYHLAQLQQAETFKKDVIFSFKWMQSELCATSFANVLRLRAEAETFEPQDPELGLLTSALRLSEPVLKRSPDQLASQLIGRLSFLSSSRIQTSSGGEAPKYPNLVRLIDDARRSPFPALLPQGTCLAEPGEEPPVHLHAHVGPINAMDLTADGDRLLTASKDDTVKVWDMTCNGRRVFQSISGVGAKVFSLIWAVNDTCAVTVEPGCVRVWLLADQKCIHRFETGADSLVATAVSNADLIRSALLVAIYDGTNKINVWDLQTGSCRTHSVSLKGKSIHQSRSVLLARNCRSSCFLYSFRDSNDAVLQNASNGNIVYSLKCRENSSMVAGVAITPDYLVLACRQLYLSQEIHQLELFDPSNGLYLRSVRGCVHDIISSPLVVPRAGSNILTLSTSRQNSLSNVTVWDLETESHKHLFKHPGISELLACGHIRSVLTASRGDNYIKQWDLSVKINQPSPGLKSESSICQITAIDTKPDYFVTLSTNNGPIGLWTFNGVLNNISTTPKKGFLDPSDVVLLNNTKLVILSDRRLPSPEDDLNQVFQTILIYDMETERCDKRLSDCFIDVSPAHDYVILPGDRLMGLSSSRSHFIIWSLVSSKVVQRIKTFFKGPNWSRTPSKDIQIRESSSTHMTPWDKRSETVSARAKKHERKAEEERCRLRELRKEKENPVDAFLVSGDRQILVVSYFAHHLCVFEIETQQHLTTVEDKDSMLFLHAAAITPDGSHFVHATYDETNKTGYVTLRESRFGQVKRRLKNEKDVCAVALTDGADRVVMVKHTNEIHIWDPMVTNSLRKRKLPKSMKLDFDSRLFLAGGGSRAVLFAGQVSLWDLDRAEQIATFSPDNKVLCCNIISQGDFIILGTSDETQPNVLTVKNADDIKTSNP